MKPLCVVCSTLFWTTLAPLCYADLLQTDQSRGRIAIDGKEIVTEGRNTTTVISGGRNSPTVVQSRHGMNNVQNMQIGGADTAPEGDSSPNAKRSAAAAAKKLAQNEEAEAAKPVEKPVTKEKTKSLGLQLDPQTGDIILN